jgi:hypothetical protein
MWVVGSQTDHPLPEVVRYPRIPLIQWRCASYLSDDQETSFTFHEILRETE